MPKPKTSEVTIPVNTWLIHKQSRNAFMVTKVNQMSVETLDSINGKLVKGMTNRFILEYDLAHGAYAIDKKGAC